LETFTILVVDDDRSNLDSVRMVLEKEGYRVLGAGSGREALEVLRRERVHLMLTDFMMPGMDGLELLKAARQVVPETDVVIMTAYGTIEKAVEAMRLGAEDFLTKPLKRFLILRTVTRVLERQRLLVENESLRKQLEEVTRDREIIGASGEIRRLMNLVAQVAPSSARVLILGESGTGKELFARALHFKSERRNGPFVAINCAAIPESLIESELFGHEKGAFTGADRRKEGRFKQADGGTLFLDEIGEMPLGLQTKLLRVIQEMEFHRVGGTEPVKVDVRVLASTNRKLPEEVAAGRFREDLYYRLSVISLEIPALRDRREDVPLLAQHFLAKFARANGKPVKGLTREALDRLMAYHWPGNVRELENVMERAVILCSGEAVDVAELPEQLAAQPRSEPWIRIPIGTPLDQVERRLIEETLKWTGGDKKLAASVLNTSLRTLYRRLEEYGQEVDPEEG
jgi:two-component system response regulator HydG